MNGEVLEKTGELCIGDFLALDVGEDTSRCSEIARLCSTYRRCDLLLLLRRAWMDEPCTNGRRRGASR